MYLQSVDYAGDVAQDREEDVDEEVGIASALEENPQRWQKDGEDDFANVTMREKVSSVSIGQAGP